MVLVETTEAERELLVGNVSGRKVAGGASKQMERLMLPMAGCGGRVCAVDEIRDGSSEVSGSCRGLLGGGGGGTGMSSGLSRPRNQCPRFCCRGGSYYWST